MEDGAARGAAPKVRQRPEHLALRDRWRAEGRFGDRSFGAALVAAAADWPEAAIVFDDPEHGGRLTVAELLAESRRVAAGLQALGVEPGDAVAIQAPNWIELPAAYFGALLAGAVVVPIVHIYGPAEMSYIIRDAEAKVLIVPGRWRSVDYAERVAGLHDVPSLTNVVVIGEEPGGRFPAHAVAWSDLVSGDRTAPREVEIDPDDVAVIIYTSGTTGSPKGVQHSHNTLLAEVRGVEALSGSEGREGVVLCPWPAGHVAGVISICRTAVTGATTVIMSHWDPVKAVRLIERYRCTSASGAPVHLMALMEAARSEGCDISSLRTFLVGAANVPAAVVEQADAAGIAAFRCYGSSEHPTVTCSRPDAPPHKRARTDGPPREGNEVRIVDPSGNDLPAGRVGEIVTRGPELFLGYRDPRMNAEAFLPGGWYRTGDAGFLDEDGYLTVTDRIKDIIIRGGENIASKEVEDILAEHPAVAEAAVVGQPEARLGERVTAFVRLAEGGSLDLAEMREHFRKAGVARQKTPERIIVVADLPRTPSGKVRKVDLRGWLRGGDGPGCTVLSDTGEVG